MTYKNAYFGIDGKTYMLILLNRSADRPPEGIIVILTQPDGSEESKYIPKEAFVGNSEQVHIPLSEKAQEKEGDYILMIKTFDSGAIVFKDVIHNPGAIASVK